MILVTWYNKPIVLQAGIAWWHHHTAMPLPNYLPWAALSAFILYMLSSFLQDLINRIPKAQEFSFKIPSELKKD